jgi:DNA/RNA endonuclease YhcR with UshA esterase domain
VKTWPVLILAFALGTSTAPFFASQKSEQNEPVPKYDVEKEAKFKGTVDDVKDRECPISGGMGSHLMVKIDNKIYEAHLAPSKTVKDYEIVFNKGDEIEITGIKTTYQGVDAILVREIKRGNDSFVFRDPKGKPIW